MQTAAVNTRLFITQVGDFARGCLRPGQQVNILASFSKAIYLIKEDRELFWLAPENTPMHRRAAFVTGQLPQASKGSRFLVTEDQLIIDSQIILELDHPLVWHSPVIEPGFNSTELASKVDTFITKLDCRNARGFGLLIPSIISFFEHGLNRPWLVPGDLTTQFAAQFVLNFLLAFEEGNGFSIRHNTKQLIGLGSGLTPSGDDFLGGLFFAIHSMKAAFQESDVPELGITLETYRFRTNSISFSMLNDLAHGYGPEPLHHLMNGLIGSETDENLYLFTKQLTRIGASTGWDLLAGLTTGILLASRRLRTSVLAHQEAST